MSTVAQLEPDREWIEQVITLKFTAGEQQITAIVCGQIAIHPSIGARGALTITHVPTGVAFYEKIRYPVEFCKAIAYALRELKHFDRLRTVSVESKEDLSSLMRKRWYRELAQEANIVVREVLLRELAKRTGSCAGSRVGRCRRRAGGAR